MVRRRLKRFAGCVFVGTTSGNKYQRRRRWRYELEMTMERRRETKQPYIYPLRPLLPRVGEIEDP